MLDLFNLEVFRPLRNLEALKLGSMSGEFVRTGIISSLDGYDIILLIFYLYSNIFII